MSISFLIAARKLPHTLPANAKTTLLRVEFSSNLRPILT